MEIGFRPPNFVIHCLQKAIYKTCKLQCPPECLLEEIPMWNSIQHAFVSNSQNHRPRCCRLSDALLPEAARPRALVDWVIHSTEGERIEGT